MLLHHLERAAVAFIPDDHARCNGKKVGAVGPLFAFLVMALMPTARDVRDLVRYHFGQRMLQAGEGSAVETLRLSALRQVYDARSEEHTSELQSRGHLV